MRIAVTFCLILFAGFNSYATPIYGDVQVSSQGLFLRYDSTLYEMHSDGLDVSSDLARLRTGDYIAFEGYLVPSQKKVFVQSVDWVGLQRLLGFWKTSDGRIVEFENFTNLVVQGSKNTDVFLSFARSRLDTMGHRMSYRISPSVGSSWSFFLSDRGNVKVGRLVILEKSLTISFFDSDTGRIAKTVTMTRQPTWKNAYN